MNGTKIEIETKDGVADAYVSHPGGEGPWPAVLFYMDGLGLRPSLFAMADRLASSGYYVLLPNMYYRSGAYAPFEPATVFAGGSERERLMALVNACDDAGAMRDTAAFLDFFDGQPLVSKGKIASNGYCLGGGLSMCAACNFPDRLAAAASFHGGRFLTDPATPAQIAASVRARVYIGVAEGDRAHTAEVTARLEAALAAAKVPHAIELYPGTTHGFAVSDMPVYDQVASERHWDRLLGLLREAFA
ncbi:dienelactone hydrolase family protein [Sorangium sp. So ce834]|uniref:dienelactone hydrolase family protein n=1 Tax=Sorangium sp. So ce834 TaxID=3133321 RepID=UPI003F642675